jgi:spermidine synthase
MPRLAASALVFVTSAAVLVLEILAGRLLAPYVGVTLETFTAIIGTILAGIALGSWLGGRAADRMEPRRLLAPLIVVGGALSFASIPVIDGLGSGLRGAGPAVVVTMCLLGFFAPAAVLSAVTPVVIKIQLTSLDETGRTVGRLSAISTVGAIVGTFVTGFMLVAALPTRPTIRIVAGGLVVLGFAVAAWLGSRRVLTAGVAGAVLVAGLFSFAAADPCEHESAYFCARVDVDPERASGRLLWLDTLRHSYVDLDDPTHLEFSYTQVLADVVESVAPPGEPLDVVHVGGGGFTMPRWLAAVRPGSTSVVLELDPRLVVLAETELGFDPVATSTTSRTGDARVTLAALPRDAADVVIGDAFGGVSVPWHLTTREVAEQVKARLRAGGTYALNLIDYGPRDFARAQTATLQAVFEHVALLAPPERLADRGTSAGGNFILVASDDPIDVEAILARNAARGDDEVALTGPMLDAFVGGAPVLTDDHAPVDQLLTPLPSR